MSRRLNGTALFFIAATNLVLPTQAADQQSKRDYIYFCKGKSNGDTSNNMKRYGIKITEPSNRGTSGVLLVRAYDSNEENGSFRLGRGELLTFRVVAVGVGSRCAKYGWRAVSQSYSLVLCAATQGVADLNVFDIARQRKILSADCDHVWIDD